MGDTLRSMENLLNDSYRDILVNMAKSMGDNAKSPDDISKSFPIEIIPRGHYIPSLQQAVEKKAYAHWGYFSTPTGSGKFRDIRIENVNAFSEFNEIVCFRGEIYVYRSMDGGTAIYVHSPRRFGKNENCTKIIPQVGCCGMVGIISLSEFLTML